MARIRQVEALPVWNRHETKRWNTSIYNTTNQTKKTEKRRKRKGDSSNPQQKFENKSNSTISLTMEAISLDKASSPMMFLNISQTKRLRKLSQSQKITNWLKYWIVSSLAQTLLQRHDSWRMSNHIEKLIEFGFSRDQASKSLVSISFELCLFSPPSASSQLASQRFGTSNRLAFESVTIKSVITFCHTFARKACSYDLWNASSAFLWPHHRLCLDPLWTTTYAHNWEQRTRNVCASRAVVCFFSAPWCIWFQIRWASGRSHEAQHGGDRSDWWIQVLRRWLSNGCDCCSIRCELFCRN